MTPIRRIVPTPHTVTFSEGFLVIGKAPVLMVGNGLSEDVSALFIRLLHQFTAGFASLRVEADASLPPFCAVMGTATVAEPEAGWSYSITVHEGGVSLNARNIDGLRYAFYTFLQLLERRGEDAITGYAAPCCTVSDRPQLDFRCLHIAMLPEYTPELMEKALMLAAFSKYNYAVLEPWGSLELDCYPAWQDVHYSKKEIAAMVKRVNTMGLKVIPMFNSLGHANSGQDALGKNAMLEVNPALTPYLEPDGYDWCISNPAVPKLLKRIRQELYETFGSCEYCHVGGDEAYFLAECDRCRQHDFIPLVEKYLNSLCEEICAEGRRPILWSDMLLRASDWKDYPDILYANSTIERPTHGLISSLDRRFVIADWQYEATTFPEPTAAYFHREGFDTILCPWKRQANLEVLARTARADGISGVMLTTWHYLTNLIAYIAPYSEMLWGKSDAIPIQPTMLSTELLRKLRPTGGVYSAAGWMDRNVERILW